jgi:hypothetical protein
MLALRFNNILSPSFISTWPVCIAK